MIVTKALAAATASASLFGAPLAAQSLSPESVARIVTAAAAELERGYVFPDGGRAMADTLKARVARGAYAGLADRAVLVERLTAELREVSRDRHLVFVAEGAARVRGAEGPRRETRADLLPDGIGYLSVRVFDGDLLARLPGFMTRLSATPALIIDLRDCPGGNAEAMLALAGYLLPQRTLLGSIYSRQDDSMTELWTRDPTGPRFADRPVFVLTSRLTSSAAEALAYHLQALGRITVVGDTTGGAAHRVREVGLGERVTMWLPYTRVLNAVTGTDWEGTGVIPDVLAAAEQALEVARKEAGLVRER